VLIHAKYLSSPLPSGCNCVPTCCGMNVYINTRFSLAVANPYLNGAPQTTVKAKRKL
jgi:hypothetical protein